MFVWFVGFQLLPPRNIFLLRKHPVQSVLPHKGLSGDSDYFTPWRQKDEEDGPKKIISLSSLDGLMETLIVVIENTRKLEFLQESFSCNIPYLVS